jgi:hypothetical protein
VSDVSEKTSADPIRNFTLKTEERIRALTIGVPAYSARKRKIEDQEAAMVRELVALHAKLAAKEQPADAIERALRAAAAAFRRRLEELNKLVETHNRYFPIEANLPLNLRREYVAYGRPWKPEEPYTADRLLALARARTCKDG